MIPSEIAFAGKYSEMIRQPHKHLMGARTLQNPIEMNHFC
jgi:hypothetical protein